MSEYLIQCVDGSLAQARAVESVFQVFYRFSFLVNCWFEVRSIFDRSFTFLVPLSSLELYFINSILALWLLVFWFFGAPSVPFTHVYFVDTHIFVSTYALCVLYARVWLRLSQLLSLLIAFDLTYWKRLIFYLSILVVTIHIYEFLAPTGIILVVAFLILK